uniref:Methyl-CpG-binding domain protein 1-like n=2 Tax=Scleropages formosus TaxID=113540 RepID=A0A8C9SSX7_SCLFO
MNEGPLKQPVEENEVAEEDMGEEDSATKGRARKRVVGVTEENVGQMADTLPERNLEVAVLEKSQEPSVGTGILEVRSLNHKEKVETETGDAVVNAVAHPPKDRLGPLEYDGGTEPKEQNWNRDPLPISGKSGPDTAKDWDVLKVANGNSRSRRRRRANDQDDNWSDWPALGDGWKRKEVLRRSGFTVGKADTYYMSPHGERVRSKIEMVKCMAGTLDLSSFDFKSGKFLDKDAAKRMRKRQKVDSASTADEGVTHTETHFQNRLSHTGSRGTGANPVTQGVRPEGEGTHPGRDASPSQGTPSRTRTPDLPESRTVVQPAAPPCPPEGVTLEQNSNPEKCRSPESTDTACSDISEPRRTVSPSQTPQVTPPQVIVLQQIAVSPQVTVAGQKSSASPCCPRALSLSPHLAKASPLSIGSPLRKVSSNPSLCLGDFSPPSLSAPATPNTEAYFPYLDPPWLDPVLAPLSPTSSPERDCEGALQDQASSHCPVFQSPIPPSNSVADSLDSSMPLNGETTPLDCPSSESLLRCMNCGNSFSDTEFRSLDSTALCPSCRSEKKQVSTRNIIFRKVGRGKWVLGRRSEIQGEAAVGQRIIPKKTKILKKKRVLRTTLRRRVYEKNRKFKKSGPKKRSRRACWKCDACLRPTDCGRCDFCMDKPKFGGDNKKRQKCRLRQCQSQAMRHLLPFQLGQTKSMATVGWVGRGRRRGGRSRYGSHIRRRKSQAPWEKYSSADEDDNREQQADCDKNDEGDDNAYVSPPQPNYSIGKEGKEELGDRECKEQVDGSVASQLAKVVSDVNFDSSYGRLDIQALYNSSCSFSAQDGFEANDSPLSMMRIRELPAKVTRSGHVSLQQEPPVGRRQTGHLPALLPNPVNATARLGLTADVRVVEVDAGESNTQEDTPVITEIFSLANSGQQRCMLGHELLVLLEDLRHTVLPAHWVGLLVKGPQLQLLQCSKLSTMADTVLQIEPSFFYHIRVQDQPLLLTHPLYEAHPSRLTSVPEVVSLLLDLENYTVCQGYPSSDLQPNQEPVLHVRAAACELLVLQSQERCDKCDVTSLVL